MRHPDTSFPPNGYSFLELIVVIVLIGILSAIVLPRMSLDPFRQAGFKQQATAAVRFAQKTAISSGCTVTVSIDHTSGCTMTWDGTPAGCPATNISNPATGNLDFCNDSSTSTTVSTTTTFDRIGRPSVDLTIALDSATLTIEPETGYVHE